ncbi:hypothetical protein GCM10010965_32390 [Caldalkalibacillus thermarum]|nr:hypothetical protein GCM10010965_32390 [Caldalkalibacillus thermarum]
MANKAYKFRLYPTQEQEQLLAKTFGCVRFVYNKMLEERQHIYDTCVSQVFPGRVFYPHHGCKRIHCLRVLSWSFLILF